MVAPKEAPENNQQNDAKEILKKYFGADYVNDVLKQDWGRKMVADLQKDFDEREQDPDFDYEYVETTTKDGLTIHSHVAIPKGIDHLFPEWFKKYDPKSRREAILQILIPALMFLLIYGIAFGFIWWAA